MARISGDCGSSIGLSEIENPWKHFGVLQIMVCISEGCGYSSDSRRQSGLMRVPHMIVNRYS
jgi:hypothetical protein